MFGMWAKRGELIVDGKLPEEIGSLRVLAVYCYYHRPLCCVLVRVEHDKPAEGPGTSGSLHGGSGKSGSVMV